MSVAVWNSIMNKMVPGGSADVPLLLVELGPKNPATQGDGMGAEHPALSVGIPFVSNYVS